MNEIKTILNLVAEIGAMENINEIRKLVLEVIRKIIWYDTANFWLYPPIQDCNEHIIVDTPEKSLNAYLIYYANIDEFHQTYKKKDLLIARSTELLDYRQWTRYSEYYYDFLRLNNVYYLLAFDIKHNSIAYGAICLHRDKSNGDFTDKEHYLMYLLYPHLVNRFKWFYEKQELVSKLETDINSDVELTHGWFNMLTLREKEIVQQVLSGASNNEIAKNIGISVNTVKMHMQNIFTKLNINRRSQLFLYHGKKNIIY